MLIAPRRIWVTTVILENCGNNDQKLQKTQKVFKKFCFL